MCRVIDEFLSRIWFTTPCLQSPLLRANVNLHPLLRNNINSTGVGHSFPIPFIYSNIYAADAYDTPSPLLWQGSQHADGCCGTPYRCARRNNTPGKHNDPWFHEAQIPAMVSGCLGQWEMVAGEEEDAGCWVTLRAHWPVLWSGSLHRPQNKPGGPLRLPSNVAACRPGTKTFQGREVSMAAWRWNVLSYYCQPIPPWRRASRMISLQ